MILYQHKSIKRKISSIFILIPINSAKKKGNPDQKPRLPNGLPTAALMQT